MKRAQTFILLIVLAACARSQDNGAVVITPLLKTDTTSIGQHIVYPNVPDAEVTMAKVTIAPGGSTGWHKHTIPVFAYVLRGTLTVELKDGSAKQYHENSAFAEVFDTLHNGTNRGPEPVVLIVLYMGKRGVPNSVPASGDPRH